MLAPKGNVNWEYIKSRRIELKYSQEYVGKAIGMGNKYNYNRYETGKYRLDADYIPLLAEVLKTSVNSLFNQKVSKIET